MHNLGVIGNPIEHSLSPKIFNLFALQFGISLNYEKILVKDKEHFSQTVNDFFKNDGMALNITSPFKEEAYLIAKNHTARASFCRASNFLSLDKNKEILADTTDGIGLVKDLEVNNSTCLKNKKILIIGSGFVLDSILLDFIVKNPSEVSILARNEDRVNFLHSKFGTNTFNPTSSYDIIINSSPNTDSNTLFSQIINVENTQLCYDLGYSPTATLFLNTVQHLNSNIILKNGLGMLVEQAAVAFTKLFNKTPDTLKVINQLKENV